MIIKKNKSEHKHNLNKEDIFQNNYLLKVKYHQKIKYNLKI